MPLLDEQRLLQKTGDIRTGVKMPDNSKNGFHPAAIDTFRFTSDSEYAISQVAERLGGTVTGWEVDDRKRGWQVVTERDVIAVLIPPQQVITQDYEMWAAHSTLLRRCDSRTEVLSGEECKCPHAPLGASAEELRRCALERDELAKKGKACSRYTRLSVQIPSLPDIGVWRLVTGGFYAAGELANKAEALEMARRAGVILPAVLRLTQRQRPARPEEKSRRYVVPVLELLHSVQEIVSGQIPAGLTAAVDTLIGRAAPVLALETAPGIPRAALPAGSAAQSLPSEPPADGPDEPADPEPWQVAAGIYQAALRARTAEHWKTCKAEARRLEVLGESVCTSTANETYAPLSEALDDIWRASYRKYAAAAGTAA